MTVASTRNSIESQTIKAQVVSLCLTG